MGSALGTPDGTAAAQAAAKQILAEGRFHNGPVPRPLKGLLDVIGNLLHPITHALSNAFNSVASDLPGGRAALWAILGAILLAAAAALTSISTRRVMHEGGDDMAARGGQRLTPETVEADAEQAERDGRLQDAVRLRFQAGLMRLAERDLIASASATPNAQLRRTLRSERFDALAHRFDEIVYGGDEAQEADVQDARRQWPLLVRGER